MSSLWRSRASLPRLATASPQHFSPALSRAWAARLSSASCRRELVLEDLEMLARIYRAIWEAEDREDPSEGTSFDELLVMRGPTTVAEVRTLDYGQFGGPEPYHDQLLWSVYLPSTTRLIAQLGELATTMNVKLTRIQGVDAPTENLWTRAVDFVTGR
jgi:hypothetical protein